MIIRLTREFPAAESLADWESTHSWSQWAESADQGCRESRASLVIGQTPAPPKIVS